MAIPGRPFFSALNRRMWGPFAEILALAPSRAGELEARVARLEAEREVLELHLRYTYAYDANDVEGVMRCFHDDCVLVNPRGTYVGRDAIAANYTYLVGRRRLSFHSTTNVVVRVSEDGREAGMTAYLNAVTVQASAALVGLSGTYVDRLAKTNDGWRILERRITANLRYQLPPEPKTDAAVPPPPKASGEGSQDWLAAEALL